MDGKPWQAVFTWLTDETGKPVITVYKPTGSLTFIGPANKEYTMPEVIDIINEGLLSNSQTQKYYLINRERSFTLIPADEKVDPILVPRIKVEDLVKHGDTELVSLVLALQSLVADDIAPQIKKMMGPFGEVVPMTHTGVNNLIMMDTVGNLKQIVEMIKLAEHPDTASSDSYSRQLKWILAREAEHILQKVLGDPADMIKACCRCRNRAWTRAIRAAGRRLLFRRFGMHSIVIDEETNTILVSGPPDKVAVGQEDADRHRRCSGDPRPTSRG